MRTCLEQWTKRLVPNVTIFLKLPLNGGHLSITDKFFKTRSVHYLELSLYFLEVLNGNKSIMKCHSDHFIIIIVSISH